MNISIRAQNTPPSPIRKLAPLAESAKRKGVKIYHLNIGQPDIKSPKKFIRALKNYPEDIITYEQSPGNSKLRQSLSEYYKNHNILVAPEDVIITVGGSEAIFFSLLTVCDPGDECLLFEPTYANYFSFAEMAGIKIKAVSTESKDGFHLPGEIQIKKQITKKTRVLVICNPNNPTGTVLTMSELQIIDKLAKKHNLFILSDETYREFVYDNTKHHSLLNISDNPQHVILVDSFSKRYSLCGARLGSLVSYNKKIIDSVTKFAQARLSAPTVEQFAALEALKTPATYLNKTINEFNKRRDALYNGLTSIPGIFVHKPEGAFYMTVTLPVKNAEHFAKWLLTDFRLKNQTVMLAPASGFYFSKNMGKNQVRIAYVLNTADLKKAVTILQQALELYKSSNPPS
jgi:aspartate aminotransferase